MLGGQRALVDVRRRDLEIESRRGEQLRPPRGNGRQQEPHLSDDTLLERHMLPASQLVSTVIADVLRRQPLSPGKVTLAWKTAVGSSLGRVTTAELQQNGTLAVLGADERWTQEIERLRPLILPRVQALLGADVVQRIVVRAGTR
jgi:hypothetical protein